MLWQRSLVMRDPQTGSLWSHLLGECMRGPLKGKQLEAIPSVMTDWRAWRRKHPETTVLNMSRTARGFRRDFYKKPERFVVGLVVAGEAKAWPFPDLIKQRLVNDQVAGQPLLIYFDPETGAAWAWSRQLMQRELQFRRSQSGTITDTATGSTWDLETGKATKGVFAGNQLRPLVAIPSFRKSWSTFHPDTAVWSSATERKAD